MTAREILTLCCRIAADANIQYCLSINEPPPPAWDGLTNAMQEGMIQGAKMALAGSSPAQSHENWCKTRLAEGWTYATITDRENKKHACLVPYEELPEAQRVKDALFQHVVCAVYDALMPGDRAATYAAAGINIERHLDTHKSLFSRGEVRQMSPEKIEQLLQEFKTPLHVQFSEAVRGLSAATDALNRATKPYTEIPPAPGRVYGATLGKFVLKADITEHGSCCFRAVGDRVELTVHRNDAEPLRIGFVRLGHPRLISNALPAFCIAPGKDPDFAYWSDYKVNVILGVQRFGSGWRVYAPGNRIICDIEAGDELVECFGAEIEAPAPTGEPPSDVRAKLDAELQEEGQ